MVVACLDIPELIKGLSDSHPAAQDRAEYPLSPADIDSDTS